MGNVTTVQKAVRVESQSASLLFNDQLKRYSSLPVIDHSGEGAALVVTDVVGSTALWALDDETMLSAIVAQNAAFRSELQALNRGVGLNLIKVNEIGDSWVVVSQGPMACRSALRFAEKCAALSKLPIRIGAHFGNFSIVRLDRYDANGFLPMQYECFGLNRMVLEEVKRCEQESSPGAVRQSQAFQAQLRTEAELESLPRPVVTPPIVPKPTNGYLLFLWLRCDRLATLQRMCRWGANRLHHADFKVVSLEDEGRVWSMVAHTQAALIEWFRWAEYSLLWDGLKASVVYSDRLWQIQDQCQDPFQAFVRYVSSDQNVAARIVALPGPWGTVRCPDRLTLQQLLPNHDAMVWHDVVLKGVAHPHDVYIVDMTAPTTTTPGWFACAACACGATTQHRRQERNVPTCDGRGKERYESLDFKYS